MDIIGQKRREGKKWEFSVEEVLVGVRSWPIRFKNYRRRRSRATTATVSGGATARGYIIKTVKLRPVGRAIVAAFRLYTRAHSGVGCTALIIIIFY